MSIAKRLIEEELKKTSIDLVEEFDFLEEENLYVNEEEECYPELDNLETYYEG